MIQIYQQQQNIIKVSYSDSDCNTNFYINLHRVFSTLISWFIQSIDFGVSFYCLRDAISEPVENYMMKDNIYIWESHKTTASSLFLNEIIACFKISSQIWQMFYIQLCKTICSANFDIKSNINIKYYTPAMVLFTTYVTYGIENERSMYI